MISKFSANNWGGRGKIWDLNVPIPPQNLFDEENKLPYRVISRRSTRSLAVLALQFYTLHYILIWPKPRGIRLGQKHSTRISTQVVRRSICSSAVGGNSCRLGRCCARASLCTSFTSTRRIRGVLPNGTPKEDCAGVQRSPLVETRSPKGWLSGHLKRCKFFIGLNGRHGECQHIDWQDRSTISFQWISRKSVSGRSLHPDRPTEHLLSVD